MSKSYLVATVVYWLRIGDHICNEQGELLGQINWMVSGINDNIRVSLATGVVLDLPARSKVAVVKFA